MSLSAQKYLQIPTSRITGAKLGDYAGDPRDNKIQQRNHMIMNQLKFRLKQNITYNLYKQYDQEDRSPAKKGAMNAKTERLEQPWTGVMLATSDLQSDFEYEPDDEDVDIAHVYCIRVRQPDVPQSPLAEMYVSENANEDKETVDEEKDPSQVIWTYGRQQKHEYKVVQYPYTVGRNQLIAIAFEEHCPMDDNFMCALCNQITITCSDTIA